MKGTRKLNWNILTITDVFLNQKRVNVCEYMAKTAPRLYLNIWGALSKALSSLSTYDWLVLVCNKDVTYKKFTYHPRGLNKFNKIFRDHNTVLTPQNKFSIKNLLNSNLKDNIPPEKKSGIYQINCKDCEKIYIGKTKRDLETRVKEHFRNVKKWRNRKISSSNTCMERKTCHGS